ncbi:uncharacterized protein LOC135389338 [Ornithodoros turicata]|uniref:uncharacterized protein LOC135389338 n=1 Tax=Ornithodoros turicata TaxID=34597 RepID=UPI00313A3800
MAPTLRSNGSVSTTAGDDDSSLRNDSSDSTGSTSINQAAAQPDPLNQLLELLRLQEASRDAMLRELLQSRSPRDEGPIPRAVLPDLSKEVQAFNGDADERQAEEWLNTFEQLATQYRPVKLDAVSNYPKPRNVHEVRRFLGLTGYFRRFVPHYALKARALTELTKKVSEFVWGDQQQDAFEALRKELTNAPVLALYNRNADTELHTDASHEGLAEEAGRTLQAGEGEVNGFQLKDGMLYKIHEDKDGRRLLFGHPEEESEGDDNQTPRLDGAQPRTRNSLYLASGSYLSSVAYSFRIGFTTIKRIVYETCTALWEELMPIYLPNPSPDVWAQSAKQFEERWSFPNCIGAVDGKHIIIEAPHRAGSMFYNYKGSHSIVLMAVADAKYKFLYADIGAYGSQSDGGVFKSCSLGKDLEAGRLGLPAARRLPGSSLEAPYVFVGDEAFQLRPDFLRPFPGADLDDTKRVYNIRLSHARRCVENAFGILASRWRIFRRPINVKVENVDLLVQACVVLHNFLRVQEETAPGREAYCPPGFADRNIDASDAEDGQWRNLLARNPANALEDLRPTLARRFSREAASVRNVFADYFVSAEGAVSWQWAKAGVKEPL